MKLITASTGSFPRIGDSAELQTLRRTIASVDRGERTTADLVGAESEMTRQAIADQARAGIELLTDGQIRWNDPISYLAGKLSGVRINGLLRFFDTNFYFRQPVLTSRPERRGELVISDFGFSCNALGSLPTPPERAGKLAMKPVLTGPYTLAKFSLVEDGAMGDLEARAMAYAGALAGEIEGLADAGAEMIQVDEPAILRYPKDWPVFLSALEPLLRTREDARKRGRRVQLALYVYFHDCVPHYERLVGLPVDAVGLDFSYNSKLVDIVASAGSPVPLGLGLVDGRNTMLEKPEPVARQVEKMLPKISGQHAYLGSSCGLEYLPRDRACAKLELVARIGRMVKGVQ